ncbi:MAG: hypothetical protein ABUS79_11050 [Pseudomonadota bacterium]
MNEPRSVSARHPRRASAAGWRAWLAALLFGGAACAGCARGSTAPPRQVEPPPPPREEAVPPAARPAKAAQARAADTAGAAGGAEATDDAAAAAPAALPPFLRPTKAIRCPDAFPRGYRFAGAAGRDTQELFRIIWRDGISRGDNIVALAPDDPRAPDARCIAAGPHRDLNLANWCCRAGGDH